MFSISDSDQALISLFCGLESICKWMLNNIFRMFKFFYSSIFSNWKKCLKNSSHIICHHGDVFECWSHLLEKKRPPCQNGYRSLVVKLFHSTGTFVLLFISVNSVSQRLSYLTLLILGYFKENIFEREMILVS